MAFTNTITLGHKNLTEKTFTFATNVAAGLSSQDAADAGAAYRLLSTNLATVPVTTNKFDVLLTWSIADQVDWLTSSNSGTPHALGTSANMFASMPYGFWTAAHTTAALALPAENGMTQKSRRMAVLRMLINSPNAIDPSAGVSLKSTWDSLTTGMSYTDKIMILMYTNMYISISNGTLQYMSQVKFVDDFQLILSDIATNATGLSTRLLLINTIMAISSRNESLFSAFMTDNNLLANFLAANADAKKALYIMLTQGIVAISNVLYNIISVVRANPTAYANLLAKCTTVTKAANDTSATIVGAPTGKCILIRSSSSATASISITMGGVVTNSNATSKDSTGVLFTFNGTMPALTTTAWVPKDTNTYYPFNAPYFANNNAATDTLTMSFLDCGV
jgi:hypothetical protein